MSVRTGILYVTVNRKRYQVRFRDDKLTRVQVDNIAGHWQTIYTEQHAGRSPHVKRIEEAARTASSGMGEKA